MCFPTYTTCKDNNESELYLKINYPKIQAKLHSTSLGEICMATNQFAYREFIKRNMDNGDDPILENIKLNIKWFNVLAIWVIFVVIISLVRH